MRTPRRSAHRRKALRTALLAFAASTAALLGPAAGPAAAAERAAAPDGGPMIFSGSASIQVRVVFDALGDHAHLGTCSGRDPVGMFDSFTASLVEVPTPLLGGNVECGKQITLTTTSGAAVTATIVGSCGSCSGSDLAVSPALFVRLASAGQYSGSIPVTWQFAN